MGLAPPKITKRSRAIDAVQRILASWEAYARSGQADNPDEAIRGFVGNLLDSVDFARMKPNMRRLALLGVCCCLPMSQLIRVRARAESEFTLLAQCLAATEKR